MNLEFFSGSINIVILGICLCVGYILKNVVPSEKVNRFIPLIAGVLGVGLAMWMNGGISPETILTGLCSGLASTGLYEAFRNLLNGAE